MSDLRTVLKTAKTVAIVGCSDNPFRASNHAARSLVESGYTVLPVNPKYRTVNGIACFPSFEDIPVEIPIDIINIFRSSEHTLAAVESVIARSELTGTKPVIWTQPGVSSPEAELAANRAGFCYIQDRCIMTELFSLQV
ncbi:MAG TPA: CoA-binding protein [Rhodothermia bacterium]|nr:CoA-binding protein [Rhodothermia bacterium]